MITSFAVVLSLLLGPSIGFQLPQPRNALKQQLARFQRISFAPSASRAYLSTTAINANSKAGQSNQQPQGIDLSTDARAYNSTQSLNEALKIFCQRSHTRVEAMPLLESVESRAHAGDRLAPNAASYSIVMRALSSESATQPQELEEILARMRPFCNAPAAAYNIAINSWSRSQSRESPENADRLLKELWSNYNMTRDPVTMPNPATYMAVMTAYSRKGSGDTAAIRTEELLEEMEVIGVEQPSLRPVTPFVNVVLHAWSKRGSPHAIERCRAILQRMQDLALSGRTQLAPSTVSFNTVIDALARCNNPKGGEELLMTMDELSREHTNWSCEPDSISFNTVLKGWAKTRTRGSAVRAEEILKHMERRHRAKETDLAPDEASFANVIHAYAQSNDPGAFSRAYGVLNRMDTAFEDGNIAAKPSTMVYNSMINVLAKSKLRDAPEKALDLLDRMKSERIRRDVFTYTSLMDVFAKSQSLKWSEKAEQMLDEMLEEYHSSGQADLKPNVRTFTSVINAIARSNKKPERALKLLSRMREVGVEPDSISYNAVMNAYGWSKAKGKEDQAFALLQEMLDPDSTIKPDIITANSVLHCCGFAITSTEAERARAMEVAIQTLEIFEKNAPTYGWPDHSTFSHMLLAIARQMPMSENRESLAEATFWRCCKAGHVSSLVIQRLQLALSKKRLAGLLGSAIRVNNGSTFIFSMEDLPADWQRYAPKGRKKWSKPSKKKDERSFTKENTKRRRR